MPITPRQPLPQPIYLIIDTVKIEPQGRSYRLPMTLRWRPFDPIAVTFMFPGGLWWEVSRDLLARAVIATATVGEGTVQFRPCAGCGEHLIMLLHAAASKEIFRLNRADLYEFVARTEGQPCIDPLVALDRFLIKEGLAGAAE